jgi:hypothetical protein
MYDRRMTPNAAPAVNIEEIVVSVHDFRLPDGRLIGTDRVLRFNVTCGRFRAELPACLRDDCASGYVRQCTVKVDYRKQHPTGGKNSYQAWQSHAKRFCHDWHRDRVEAFAAEIAHTYGSHRPFKLRKVFALSTVTFRPEFVASFLGMTPAEVTAELAKASC